MSVVHYVVYEPPLAAFIGCGRRIRYDKDGAVVFSQRGTISTDPSDVTCAVCLRHIGMYEGRAPRVLGPALAGRNYAQGSNAVVYASHPVDARITGGTGMSDSAVKGMEDREVSAPNIAELRELLTRAPSLLSDPPDASDWRVTNRLADGECRIRTSQDNRPIAREVSPPHAALIVAAVNALPALLDRIEELDKRVEDLRVSRGEAIREASERAWMGGEAAGRRDSQTRIEVLEKALREIRAEGLHSNGTNYRKWYAETARAALDSAVEEWRTGK